MFRWLILAMVMAAGCGGGDSAGEPTEETSTPAEETSTPAEDTTVVEPEVTAPAEPATLSQRGFVEVRLIGHLHSAFSHDGCDDASLDAEGNPNVECIQRMKRALCSERIGLAYMTDHRAHTSDRDWEELFYADVAAGDELLRNEKGVPWAARFACSAGEGGAGGRVTLMVGYESTHTMPFGLRSPMDWSRHHSFKDSASAEALTAVTETVAELGGLVAIAHSEETDLSAETIARHDVHAMELYNFHANFNEVLGDGFGDALFSLEHFLDPEASIPDPDLSALILLQNYPVGALEKWRAVSAVRPIVGFAGSDAHENVSFAAACKDTTACDGLARLYPNLVAYLQVGGPVWQSDGERIDGYARVFRWVQNRVWVPAADAADPLAVDRAFRAGRAYAVFEVLGDAREMTLVVTTADDTVADLGETVALEPGLTLWARSPDAPAPAPFAHWTDGAAAEIESVVWRSDAEGTHEVLRWTGPAEWRSVPVTEPGSYQLEVTIVPRHLTSELGPAADLAERTYRWVESNAIRLE